ncbi:MAG: NADH-quinone oxidoreductase subunit NuoE [Nitrospirota bacterium]|nr:NADH-quinone oxidoreductase subunit NuoE [Nitrospirota bacterium]
MECGCEIDLSQTELIVAPYRNKPYALIPVLQKVQATYGYLPKEAVSIIARRMNIYESRVYGVATFYAQFRLQPKGENTIKVCVGTACHVKGSGRISEELQKSLGIKPGETTEDRKFSLEHVACVGACGLAPIILVNDDVYGKLAVEDTLAKLEKYK